MKFAFFKREDREESEENAKTFFAAKKYMIDRIGMIDRISFA